MGLLSVIDSVCDNYLVYCEPVMPPPFPMLKGQVGDAQLNDGKVNATPGFALGGLALPSSGGNVDSQQGPAPKD